MIGVFRKAAAFSTSNGREGCLCLGDRLVKRTHSKCAILLFLGLFCAAFSAAASAGFIKTNADGSQTLTGHVPAIVKNGTATYKYHTSVNLSARVIVPFSNQPQLSALLKDLYDPKSSRYHQFLTPDQFAQQFGTSTIDSTPVRQYLQQNGLTVTGVSSNGLVLTVAGASQGFEQAFGLHINTYQRKDGTTFFAPDEDPTIPPTLAGKVLAIGGLDNEHKYQPNYHKASFPPRGAGSGVQGPGLMGTGLIRSGLTGTGPGGYLAPSDVKTAYNLNSLPANGANQTVALFELDGYSASDIAAYESTFGLPNVPIQNILLDGFDGTPDFAGGGAFEVTLDIEMVTGFAPGSNILVYESPNSIQSWVDNWTQIASDNLAKVVSCSWNMDELDSPTLGFDSMIFQQMAAQGQSVFVASGDAGAYGECPNGDLPPQCSNDGTQQPCCAPPESVTLVVNEPAIQPYVTAVGISALSTDVNGAYVSETASPFSGGGVSEFLPIEDYQQAAASLAPSGALVSTVMRNIPDVALTADYSTGYAFYAEGSWIGVWGSSLSAPIWASFMACVNQGLGTSGPIGFVNPALYQVAQSSRYTSDFHDITLGTNSYYPAETGFDNATGLGSFNGLNLYNDLVNPAGPSNPPAMPAGVEASGQLGGVALSWVPSPTAAFYNVKRSSVNGGPYTTVLRSFLSNYFDTSVVTGVNYYVISAVNSKGESANSVQVSATPLIPPLPPAPAGFTAASGNSQVVLSWMVAPGAVTYTVGRSTVSGGPYTPIASSLTKTTYTDTTAVNGTTYYYVVYGVNLAGQGPAAIEAIGSPALGTPPQAPAALTAVAQSSEVILSWPLVQAPFRTMSKGQQFQAAPIRSWRHLSAILPMLTSRSPTARPIITLFQRPTLQERGQTLRKPAPRPACCLPLRRASSLLWAREPLPDNPCIWRGTRSSPPPTTSRDQLRRPGLSPP